MLKGPALLKDSSPSREGQLMEVSQTGGGRGYWLYKALEKEGQ